MWNERAAITRHRDVDISAGRVGHHVAGLPAAVDTAGRSVNLTAQHRTLDDYEFDNRRSFWQSAAPTSDPGR